MLRAPLEASMPERVTAVIKSREVGTLNTIKTINMIHNTPHILHYSHYYRMPNAFAHRCVCTYYLKYWNTVERAVTIAHDVYVQPKGRLAFFILEIASHRSTLTGKKRKKRKERVFSCIRMIGSVTTT